MSDISSVRLALKIRYWSRTYGPDSWRATEKPDSDLGCKGLAVGGQQKNQLLKREIGNAAVLQSPSSFERDRKM